MQARPELVREVAVGRPSVKCVAYRERRLECREMVERTELILD